MALSAAERKRNQVERERLAIQQRPDSTYEYLSTPFHSYHDEDPNWSSVTLCFELMGIEAPEFLDDRGPESFVINEALGDDEDTGFEGAERSIGRAEVMVDLLLDAAIELSGIINTFKTKELKKYLSDIEQRDLSDQAAKALALKEAVHIAAIQEELAKNVRRTFSQWKVKTG
jgi:hypothetical protein